MKLTDLSNKDKLAIAEFIYSQANGILIISDAKNVIEVFKNHKIDTDKIELEEFSVLSLINSNISFSDRRIIMQEYLSGNI